MSDDLPDPTGIDGAPHPRETEALWGQSRAEQEFLDACTTGRMHHGWLISGPRGVGKATLAWRIARFLLSRPTESATTLTTDSDSPLAHRIRSGAESGIFVLKRGPNATGSALSQDIRVDEVRKAKAFLQLSAPDGGPRIVIVDAADEMNTQAANALLKLLEEPPAGVTFLLLAHQPARLLPTIRSRCRELRLLPLGAEDMAHALNATGTDVGNDAAALAALAGGSVGEAVRMVRMEGLEAYAALVGLMSTLPRLDRPRAIQFADSVGGRQADRLELILNLTETFLTRLARGGVQGPPFPEAAEGESKLILRLSSTPAAAMRWANLHHTVIARARHGQAVNLDPAALVMDMLLEITATAS